MYVAELHYLHFIECILLLADGKPTFTTTPKPPQLMVTAEVKFVDLKNFNLPRERTQDYEDLQAQISRSLRQTELKSVPGFLDVQVINFYRLDHRKELLKTSKHTGWPLLFRISFQFIFLLEAIREKNSIIFKLKILLAC